MIGVFDSGVGGLTVVKEIFKYLPEYQIIYFGDTARLPYGTKGAGFVKRYSEKITQWLLDRGAKVIVVACHTSSAWAADFLKEKFSAKGGSASGGKNVPIFDMISGTAGGVSKITKNKKVGVIGTPGTIKSNAYKTKLLESDPELKIYTQACPLLVPLAEEGWVDGKITEEIIKKYLAPLKKEKIDTLVLACTHYPLLEEIIQKVMGRNVKIFNPASALAKQLKLFLEKNPKIEREIKKGIGHQFFFSDEPYNFEKISHLCFNKKIKPIIKDPFLS
jgi:glutamate racemase